MEKHRRKEGGKEGEEGGLKSCKIAACQAQTPAMSALRAI